MNVKFLKTKLMTLIWCVEDWTSLFFVASFVKEFYLYKDLKLVKKITLEVIKNLLEEELVIAGDLLKNNIFSQWRISTDVIIEKTKYNWDNLGRELYMYELVWFEITKKGEKEMEYLNKLPELKETDPFYFDDK